MLARQLPDFLVPLIENYLTDAPNAIRALRAAITEGHIGALKTTAHGLRGSSATLGAASLARLCREVEGLPIPSEEARRWLQQVEAAFEEAAAVLEAARMQLAARRSRPHSGVSRNDLPPASR